MGQDSWEAMEGNTFLTQGVPSSWPDMDGLGSKQSFIKIAASMPSHDLFSSEGMDGTSKDWAAIYTPSV